MHIDIKCSYHSLVDPKTLKPHPLNPNEHGQEQISLFVEILKYQGWRRPITVSKLSGYITKGHGALSAALSGGFDIVPIDYQDYVDQAQELADIVADNQLQRMSQMNMGKLQTIVGNLDQLNFDVSLTALDTLQIESMRMITSIVPPKPIFSDPSSSRYSNPYPSAEVINQEFSEPDRSDDHYVGMPEYRNENLAPWKTINVHFTNENDMRLFFETINQPFTLQTRSVWFPAQERTKMTDKRYDVK